MDVVSLLPSATEIVYALGVEPVGTSHECDYPPAAAELPAVNRSRVDPTASSSEINEQVAEAEQAAGVYEIDRETLAALDPDLVISQGICDVCAVDEVRVRDAVDALGLDAAVVTTDPHSLDDVLADIQRIGDLLGRSERARQLVADVEGRIEAVEEGVAGADRPDVAVFDWTDPVMVAGHWIPGMVDVAGGTYGLTQRGARSRPHEWTDVREYDPDIIVVAPCGFDIDQTTENIADLTDREGWNDLTAVRNDDVYLMDGHHYVNRPGPRLADTLEHLAGILHPERFDAPPPDAVRPLAVLDVP
jgi:iron complex transport system substrate-binding protein